MRSTASTLPQRRLGTGLGIGLGIGLGCVSLLVSGCTSAPSTSSGDASTSPSTPGRSGEPLDAVDRFAAQSARGIHNDALDAMRDLEDLRLRGQVTSAGETITLDVRATPTGSCTGTLGLADGITEFTQVRERAWIRPSPQFWRATAPQQADQIVEAVGDRWVTVPRGDGSFDQLCDVEALLDGLGEAEEATVGEIETLDSQQVVPLEHTDGDATSTMWVAAEEPHHILRIESEGGEEPGRLTFSDFDAKVSVKPPPDDRVADLD